MILRNSFAKHNSPAALVRCSSLFIACGETLLRNYISKKNVTFLITLFFLIAFFLIVYKKYFHSSLIFDCFQKKTFLTQDCNQDDLKKDLWINVFVHGTVGSTLSLLDYNGVKADKIEKSVYKKHVSMMRNNKSLFIDQPIMEKGLVRVEPTFDFAPKDGCYRGVFPIAKCLEEINSFVEKDLNLELSKQLFYSFGWSGCLSQRRRRVEAVRFYNELSEELERFDQKGLKPKIRILCHSHGGNLALNLAGVFHYLNPGAQTNDFYSNFDNGQEIQGFFYKLLNNYYDKSFAKLQKGKKQFDYTSQNKNLHVDELVVLGTPIQVETSMFALSPFFGNVINFYSDGDSVQGLDFLSSSADSSQRLIPKDQTKNGFYQARILLASEEIRSEVSTNASAVVLQKKKTAWWHVILGMRDAARNQPDPTHKELWFFVPNEDTKFNFLRPLPVVAFFPILRYLKSKQEGFDFDLWVVKTAEGYLFKLVNYGQVLTESSANEYLLSKEFIDQIHEKVLPWARYKDSAMANKDASLQLREIAP